MIITNISDGPRGVFQKDGQPVVLQPGESRDVELTKEEAGDLNEEWFKRGTVKQADKADDEKA